MAQAKGSMMHATTGRSAYGDKDLDGGTGRKADRGWEDERAVRQLVESTFAQEQGQK